MDLVDVTLFTFSSTCGGQGEGQGGSGQPRRSVFFRADAPGSGEPDGLTHRLAGEIICRCNAGKIKRARADKGEEEKRESHSAAAPKRDANGLTVF